MSIIAPTSGELFTVRIYKETDVSPTQVWTNTWELQAKTGATNADLVAAVNSIVLFEKGMSQDTVRFNRAVTSTWVPDGQPYDPESFTSLPLSGLGGVSSPPDAETLPLSVVLFIKKETLTGRYGKLYLRRALDETEVSGRYGVWRIDPAALSTINTRITTLLSSTGIGELLGGGDGNMRLVMAAVPAGAESPVVRFVNDLTAAGAREVKWNNRYFDRAGA